MWMKIRNFSQILIGWKFRFFVEYNKYKFKACNILLNDNREQYLICPLKRRKTYLKS